MLNPGEQVQARWVIFTFALSYGAFAGLILLNVAMGFDVDILIRRNLTYAVLTGLLAAVYFGSVILLHTIFRQLTGGNDTPMITVLSTLTLAALFNPLRSRTQDIIDRRFYRSRCDSEQALEAFAQTTRDDVDIDRFASALFATVEKTIYLE